MKVFYDKNKTKEVEERILDKWGKRDRKSWADRGFNVSEVTYCEVKCYCRRTGQEQRYTKESIGFLVFGIVSENVVMGIYPEDQRQHEANLNEIVWGHMDVYEDFKYPIEGKATAKRIYKREHLPKNWVMQLINYITMSRSNKGWLFILDIFTRQLSAWCVELTSDEKLMQIEVLMNKVSKLSNSIESEDYSELNITPEEYGLCNFKHTCPKRGECKIEAKKIEKEKREKKKRRKKW